MAACSPAHTVDSSNQGLDPTTMGSALGDQLVALRLDRRSLVTNFIDLAVPHWSKSTAFTDGSGEEYLLGHSTSFKSQSFVLQHPTAMGKTERIMITAWKPSARPS